jgi:hypothetical protein
MHWLKGKRRDVLKSGKWSKWHLPQFAWKNGESLNTRNIADQGIYNNVLMVPGEGANEARFIFLTSVPLAASSLSSSCLMISAG